jgi:hypothetical protein
MNKIIISIFLTFFVTTSTGSAWAWALGWKKHSSSGAYGDSDSSGHSVHIGSNCPTSSDSCP